MFINGDEDHGRFALVPAYTANVSFRLTSRVLHVPLLTLIDPAIDTVNTHCLLAPVNREMFGKYR